MNDNISLDEKLAQCLGPEWLSSRSGFGGNKILYIEGKTAINLANELFGHDGWSSEIKSTVVDYMDMTDDGRVSLGIATIVRVKLKDGAFHEDTGYGMVENVKGKGAAYERARKEAATDGLKRAIRMFGNATGNCIYDKAYCRNIMNMARPAAPFIPLDLYRQKHVRKVIRAEMESTVGPRPVVVKSPTARSSAVPHVPVKQEKQQQQQQPSASNSKPTLAPTSSSSSVQKSAPATDTNTSITIKMEPNTDPIDQSTSTKRPLDDDMFAEDSFIFDDEDEALIAGIVEAEVDDKVDIELLEQVMLDNRPPPSDPSIKRQRH